MAVVRAKFVKRDKHEKKRAKAVIRYIQHRPGKDGDKIIRTLFGRDGAIERTDAYRMIDEAEKRDILFKFIISPDPEGEDKQLDLNMREITASVMIKMKKYSEKQSSGPRPSMPSTPTSGMFTPSPAFRASFTPPTSTS
jgi:hypothetical protein